MPTACRVANVHAVDFFGEVADRLGCLKNFADEFAQGLRFADRLVGQGD